MAESKAVRAAKFVEQALKGAGLDDARVILFGSHATGIARPDSDVDIPIISPAFRGKDIFERAQMTKDAELRAMQEFGLPFDVVTLTPEEFDADSSMAAFIKASSAPAR